MPTSEARRWDAGPGNKKVHSLGNPTWNRYFLWLFIYLMISVLNILKWIRVEERHRVPNSLIGSNLAGDSEREPSEHRNTQSISKITSDFLVRYQRQEVERMLALTACAYNSTSYTSLWRKPFLTCELALPQTLHYPWMENWSHDIWW